MLKVKLTSKRQATFPTKVCKSLGIEAGDEIILDQKFNFDENDVKAVAPSMATEEFVNDVNMVFRKVYKIKKKKAKTRAL